MSKFAAALRLVIGSLSTMILVTFISALIWLYAERQGVKEREVGCRVHLSAKGGLLWTARTPADTDFNISVRFESTGAAEQQVRESLKDLPLAIDLPDPDKAGEKNIALKPLLEEAVAKKLATFGATLVKDGVKFDKAEKGSFVTEVAAEKELPLEVHKGTLDANCQLAVDTVKVRLPLSVWDQLPKDPLAFVDLTDIPPGERVFNQPIRRSMQVHLPNRFETQSPNRTLGVSPPIVEVAMTLKEAPISNSLKSVPVLVLCPPALADKWQFTLKPDSQFIPELILAGTESAMKQVNFASADPRESKVLVAARITSVDESKPDGSTIDASLELILPEGVRLTPESATLIRDRKAQVTMTRRPAPAPKP